VLEGLAVGVKARPAYEDGAACRGERFVSGTELDQRLGEVVPGSGKPGMLLGHVSVGRSGAYEVA